MSNSISYEGVIGLEFDSRSPKMNVNSPSSGKINGDGRVKGGCKEGGGEGQVVQLPGQDGWASGHSERINFNILLIWPVAPALNALNLTVNLTPSW